MSDNTSLVGLGYFGAFAAVAYLLSRRPRYTGECGPISAENYSSKGPIPVPVSAEPKWICRCGQSKSYPYCDGSHKAFNEKEGTSFTPLKVTAESVGADTVYVCTCGYSKKRDQGLPFCDGSHRKIEN